MELYNKLRSLKIFNPFNDIKLKELVNYSHVYTYRKNKILFYQGDNADKVFFILQGTLKSIKYRDDETSLVLKILKPGDWIGISEVIANGPYLSDVQAEETSEVLCIMKSNFKSILKDNQIKDFFFKLIAKEYYTVHTHLETHTPMQKIIRYFIAQTETFAYKNQKTGNYSIKITQENLAEIVGYTRETVNKHLQQLQDKEIIILTRGNIEILDIDLLNQLQL